MKLARHALTALVLLPPLTAQNPQDAAKPTKSAPASVLARWSPAIVTIRVVLATSFAAGGSSQDSESTAEFNGVVVDPSGLVMTNNAAFTPPDLFNASEAGGFRMRITPRDFKVVFDKDDKEYPAFLAATDKKLGLAFVQIQELGDKKLTVVDFAAEPDIAIGDEVVGLSRLGKGFDHAAYYRTTTIAGEIKKPRKAWIVDRAPAADGHPVFDRQGRVLGAMVKIASGIKSSALHGGLGAMLSGLSGGSTAGPRSFLLPGNVVGRIVKQAKAQAAKRMAEKPDDKHK